MRRLKHTFWRFRGYEGTAVSKYLNEMAGKGWYLDHISTIGTLVFEKKELEDGRFCATVVPGETEFSEEGSTEKQRFCELCEDAGWELVYSGELWQIFYTKDSGALPIETDSSLGVQAMKQNIFSGWRLLGLILVSAVLLFAMGRFYYMMPSAAEDGAQYQLIALLLTQFSILYGPLASLRWYKNAEKELSKGQPLPVTEMDTIRRRTWAEVILFLYILLLGIRSGIADSLLFAYLMLGTYRSIVSYTITQRNAPKDDRVWVVIRLVLLYTALLLGFLALAYNLVTIAG